MLWNRIRNWISAISLQRIYEAIMNMFLFLCLKKPISSKYYDKVSVAVNSFVNAVNRHFITSPLSIRNSGSLSVAQKA
jgi:hypothetical protein